MNIAGFGAFAGGLGSGYLSGESNKRAQTVTDLAKAAGTREQTAFDAGRNSAMQTAAMLEKAGYPGAANIIRQGYGQQASASPGEAEAVPDLTTDQDSATPTLPATQASAPVPMVGQPAPMAPYASGLTMPKRTAPVFGS